MIVTFHFSKKISGFTLGSRFIMWVEDLDFSHCATEIQVNPLIEGMVYEAVWPKSRKITKTEWLTHSQPVRSLSKEILDQTLANKIIASLEDELNKDYSILQLTVIGVGLLFKAIARAVDKIVVNSNKYLICSEMQSKPLKVMGGVFEEPSDSIDCRECYDVAIKITS